MLKKIFIIICLLIGNISFAANYDISSIKQSIFSKDCQHKINSSEFNNLIKKHKKDTNYPENYYAAQTKYDSYKGNNLKAYYLPKMDIMYQYSTQEQNNLRIIYYYTILGNLKNIEFLYENYPNYPYFSRKYTKSGNLIETTYHIDKSNKIMFNKDGSSYNIVKN